jgi:hypothetical protein
MRDTPAKAISDFGQMQKLTPVQLLKSLLARLDYIYTHDLNEQDLLGMHL